MTRRSLREHPERGFTIIEVMVASLLLVIGVLGTVRLIDGANASTVLTRDRVAALSLGRDVIEASRNIDYDKLICGNGTSPCTQTDAAVVALKTQLGLGSSTSGGWTVPRGNATFSIGLSVCKVDESRDSLGTSDAADPAFCATYTCPTAAVTTCTDKNPDDYRRVAVTVTWTPGSGIVGRKSVRQIALVSNPAGGLGPPIKIGPCVMATRAISTTTSCPTTQILVVRGSGRPSCPTVANCVGPPDPSCGGSSCVPMWVQTGSADTGAVNWSADDAQGSHGNATALSGSTSWGMDWLIGTLTTTVLINPFTLPPLICTAGQHPPIFDLAASQGVVLDGNYEVSVQGFDSLGVPGGLKTVPITLNRFPPAIPCPLQGGYNKPGSATGNPPAVDFEWAPNVERDIKGYKVYWENNDNLINANDIIVCGSSGPVTETFCGDTSPSSHGLSSVGDTGLFYVTAVDNFDSESNASVPLAVTIVANTPPESPRSPSGTSTPAYSVVNGQPTITWSTDPTVYGGRLDSDLTDTVTEYRIYRDGVQYANRIATVGFPSGANTSAAFTDTAVAPGHSYYVTAVDNHYQESAPAGPVP
jgi:Tfp pilus assembly protein PilV